MSVETEKPATALRRGWTTGACATAATRAAYEALLTGAFPDPVEITLPRGERPAFALALEELGEGIARAGIVKDAGDDPDVTHGALIVSRVRLLAPGVGVVFRAGEGVGTVTRAGLPVPPGEPAINPTPRRMMTEVVAATAARHGGTGDVEIEISVPGGAALAAKTLNPRLGILGGLSILGTTGIVRPFSCSAWIFGIREGIDVARAAGLAHVAGATGTTSEAAVKALYDLPDHALIDMGDFVGAMLKHLRDHPIAHVTIAGGFGKLTKLGQGMLDLHSGRSEVDFAWLAARAGERGGDEALKVRIRGANTAAEALSMAREAGVDLAAAVADAARATAFDTLRGAPVEIEVIVFARDREMLARAG